MGKMVSALETNYVGYHCIVEDSQAKHPFYIKRNAIRNALTRTSKISEENES